MIVFYVFCYCIMTREVKTLFFFKWGLYSILCIPYHGICVFLESSQQLFEDDRSRLQYSFVLLCSEAIDSWRLRTTSTPFCIPFFLFVFSVLLKERFNYSSRFARPCRPFVTVIHLPKTIAVGNFILRYYWR